MKEEFQEKSEPPTVKKLADARQKGMVAKSQDLTIAILLLVTMIVILFSSKYMYEQLQDIMLLMFNNLYFPYDDPNIVAYWLRTGLNNIMFMLLPLFLGVIATAILVNFAQIGFVFSFNPMAPKWKKLNLFESSNYKKYFSFQTVLKLLLGQMRFFVVVVASWLIVGKDMGRVYTLTNATPYTILMFIFHKSMQIGFFLSASFLIFSIVDYAYQRWKFYQDLKMTRREVRDEVKLLEGDVQMKSKMRSLMQKRLESTTRKIIPEATIVITEATQEQALALMYDPEKMMTPICFSKGLRKKAKEIIDSAKLQNIPVIEDSQLTKALFLAMEVGEPVPKGFYHAVALAFARKGVRRQESGVRR